MKKYTMKDLEKEDTLAKLIAERDSFKIIGLTGTVLKTVEIVETAIENANLRCRVFTSGRSKSLFSPFVFYSAVVLAAHNLATYDPDYEIEKHLVDSMLTVTYKR